MVQKILIVLVGIVIGLSAGYMYKIYSPALSKGIINEISPKEVIGFLPYWLTDKAQKDYTSYITTLTYFGLTIDGRGKIVKLVNEQEEDPGWHALRSGRMDGFFEDTKKYGIKRSLLIFNADEEQIGELISAPKEHAKNLISEVAPIMKKYEFTDLNLDIESVAIASEESRIRFTEFVSEIKKQMDDHDLGTLTIEASPTALYKTYLINPKTIAPLVDYFVFMTYDYHYQGSAVTGPIAPLTGGGTISEFDVEVAMKDAVKIMPENKVIMGIPLYGYEWETLGDTPRSAIIPGTGITASNRRVEDFLKSCATCSARFDDIAKESYLIYQNDDTGTYHQIFYPDKRAMEEKTAFADLYDLGGVAVWALGYEGKTILEPLKYYK